MADLNLPVDLSNGQIVLTATTPSEYWNLKYKGFSEEAVEDALSPQEKAARTRAANRAKSETSDKPDEDVSAQAGDANQS